MKYKNNNNKIYYNNNHLCNIVKMKKNNFKRCKNSNRISHLTSTMVVCSCNHKRRLFKIMKILSLMYAQYFVLFIQMYS